MSAYDLPLLKLFHRLRQEGLPLGIEEYELLLQALQAGFGVADQTALSRLCKTLWIKALDEDEEARLFDQHFKEIMAQPVVSETASLQSKVPKSRQAIINESKTTPVDALPPLAPAQPVAETQPAVTPATTSEWTFPIKDEMQVAKAVLHMTKEEDESVYDSIHSYFIETDEYFPVTRRQMKQSWRSLRRLSREGPSTEVNIEATVDSVGRLGMLLEPVLAPPYRNRAELLLLIDQGGSMVPFHTLAHRLAETASRGGRLGTTGTYYFHNCPVDYLYGNPAHQQARSIQDIVDDLHLGHTGVLIFSDAGAARGKFSLERVVMTETFLQRLKQKVRYMVWLNPMPSFRWYNTTAEEVMHLVPMFDISRRGLDDAIRVLRGRPIPRMYSEVSM